MSGRDSLNESLGVSEETTNPRQIQAKSLKRYRIGMYVCGICTLIFIVFASISAVILGSLINSQAKKGVVMGSDNEKLWAHIPGDTETLVMRNYTFFNFTNPKEVLYRNAKPVFKEVSNYKFQQFNDMQNIKYVEDGNVVQFDFWLHFQQRDSRNTNQKVKILNLGPLGFWSQVQTAPDQNFTLNGFGPLFVQLRDTLKSTVLGQGVCQQYIPDYESFLILALSAQISDQTAQFMWKDQLYGLNDPDNSEIWIEAAYNGIGSDEANHLQNYFYLSSLQMQTILLQIKQWGQSLNEIIGNWYCGIGGCSSQKMVYKQLSSSGITKNPPPGSDPIQSICSTNITCIGWPQIDNYIEHVFKVNFPEKQNLFNVKFTEQQFERFFEPSSWSYCLLHSGNLNKLFTYGRKFDETGDQQSFNKMKAMFILDDDKMFVFWNWVKYFTFQFVLKYQKNGTKGIAGIGGVASQALYQSISASSGWLLQSMLSHKISSLIRQKFSGCQQFFNATIDDLSDDQLQKLCQNIDPKQPDTTTSIINSCLYQYSQQWNKIKQKASLSDIQMSQLCDSDEISLSHFINLAQHDLEAHYDCTFTPEPGCSAFQIGYKQWNDSRITRNPIPQMSFQASWTINSWNSDLPTFEYSYYLNYMESTSMYRPNLTQIVDLLSFDKLYNGQMIQQLWLVDDKKFKQWFYWEDKQLLKQYLRFIVIEVGFGGFTQERTAMELAFGYDDPFLKDLKDQDPILGGDPSTASWIAFNEPNSTRQEAKYYPQAMYTGKNDSSITRFYAYLNGKNTITMNYSYWNGDEVINDTQSPWKTQDHFIGTDAFQVPPGIDTKNGNANMSIFINTLYRYGNAAYNDTIKRFDFDIVRAKMPPSLFESQYQRPQNSIYYQKYSGFVNQTSTAGVPMFISKNHFYDAPSNWSQLVDIYDETGKNKMTGSIYDDTYILLQPTTGTSFTASIYLQSNYQYKQDELFSRQGLMMLPIFTVWRSGNMSQHAIDLYFGDLRTGLKIKSKVTFFMIALAGICLVLTLIIVVKLQKLKKQHVKPPSMITTVVDDQ